MIHQVGIQSWKVQEKPPNAKVWLFHRLSTYTFLQYCRYHASERREVKEEAKYHPWKNCAALIWDCGKSASMNLFFWLLLLDHFWSWLHVHSENLLYSQFSKQFRSWEISKQNSWHNTKSADSWRWIKLHVLKRFNFLENVVYWWSRCDFVLKQPLHSTYIEYG